MKAGDFASLLRAAAVLTRHTGLAATATAFETSPSATVAASLRKLGVDPSSTIWNDRDGTTAGLMPLRPLLKVAGKAGALKDIEALIALLERGPSIAPTRKSATRQPTRSASAAGVVEEHMRQLESALGNQNRFPAVYEQLAADSSLSVSDLKAIAKQFAKVSAKSKADALKKIWARHQSLLSFDAKARATDGRSAA